MTRSPFSSTIAMLLGMMLATALVRGQEPATTPAPTVAPAAVAPAAVAPAAVAPATAAAPAGVPIRCDATTMILPARKIGTKELIDAAAAFLQRNILVTTNELQQTGQFVELQTPMSLDKQTAEEGVCELLYSRGLVLAARDKDKGIWEVIFASGPRQREIPVLAVRKTPAEILKQPSLKQPVTTILRLTNMNAPIATNSLRPFFAAAGAAAGNPVGLTFGTAGDNSALLLSGMQSDVAKAISIVQDLDGVAAGAAPAADGGGDLAKRVAALEQEIARLGKVLAELQQRLPAK